MYKLSVPISAVTVNDETLPVYLEQFRSCGAKRVFMCGMKLVYSDDLLAITEPDRIKRAINYFRDNGLEVGIWVGGFGHGAAPTAADNFAPDMYTPITGIRGDVSGHGFCPRDPRFAADYARGIRKIAELSPDIIMIDDDYRFQHRSYYMGCFCPHHLKEYYERIGEEIPREKLESYIMTGKKNRYRTEYLKMLGDSLIDFAKMLRKAVDEVDPTIRMGTCCMPEHWDYSGTDTVTLAKAFAGNTAPFARTFGAPYHNTNIINITETTRSEFAWGENSGVELFAEGDTWPRPRYIHSSASRTLELFDFALRANGGGDGILAYLFSYVNPPEYETGYSVRYARNAQIHKGIAEIFGGKTPVGVHVIHTQHVTENWELPNELVTDDTFSRVGDAFYSPAGEFLSQISIPTAYSECGYPLMVFGENAKYVDADQLKNGALLDVGAAKILEARGIDVGLVSAEPRRASEEFFPEYNDRIPGVETYSMQKITCKEGARVLSYFRPDDSPASYLYENKDGTRFMVMAFERYGLKYQASSNFYSNYYRQAQLIDGFEWMGRRKLPAVSKKNPGLYMITSVGEGAMSVAMMNVHLDDIITPEVLLDREYKEIRFISGSGRLEGDRVILSDIPAYGFAAFEVK